jgi:hypothetical protein
MERFVFLLRAVKSTDACWPAAAAHIKAKAVPGLVFVLSNIIS